MLDDPGMGGVRGGAFKWAERARSSPYYPALRHPVFRKVLPGAALSALLGPPGYVALLGVSSVLSAWGLAGKYTLVADLLPAEQRVAGNSVFGLADQLSLMIGPALAGVLTALAGPAVVIALDAASWAVLAVSYARIAPLAAPPPAPAPEPGSAPAAAPAA